VEAQILQAAEVVMKIEFREKDAGQAILIIIDNVSYHAAVLALDSAFGSVHGAASEYEIL